METPVLELSEVGDGLNPSLPRPVAPAESLGRLETSRRVLTGDSRVECANSGEPGRGALRLSHSLRPWAGSEAGSALLGNFTAKSCTRLEACLSSPCREERWPRLLQCCMSSWVLGCQPWTPPCMVPASPMASNCLQSCPPSWGTGPFPPTCSKCVQPPQTLLSKCCWVCLLECGRIRNTSLSSKAAGDQRGKVIQCVGGRGQR